jgi:hypothetical protein
MEMEAKYIIELIAVAVAYICLRSAWNAAK